MSKAQTRLQTSKDALEKAQQAVKEAEDREQEIKEQIEKAQSERDELLAEAAKKQDKPVDTDMEPPVATASEQQVGVKSLMESLLKEIGGAT